jgi:hypothetical protein
MGKFRTYQQISPDEKLDFLAVLATEAFLRRHNGGATFLHTAIDNQSQVVTTTKERKQALEEAEQKSDWLTSQLHDWRWCDDKDEVMVADGEHPLMLLAGDVDLWVRVREERFALRTLRDIKPEGWITPGGFPGSLEELLRPTSIQYREVDEEVVIGNEKTIFYSSLGSPDKALSKNLDDWGEVARAIQLVRNFWELGNCFKMDHDAPRTRCL